MSGGAERNLHQPSTVVHTPVNPAFGRQREKDQEFKASLGCIRPYPPNRANNSKNKTLREFGSGLRESFLFGGALRPRRCSANEGLLEQADQPHGAM